MNKLLFYSLLIVFFMSLLALQADEELSMHSLFDTKRALNRSTHAAAQAVDQEKLADGIMDLNKEEARATALVYLRENLRLDENLLPLPGSFLQGPVSLLALDVIGADQSFPYLYEEPLYQYSVTLERPGVIMIIRLDYPRIYNMMAPVTWVVKSASELVY